MQHAFSFSSSSSSFQPSTTTITPPNVAGVNGRGNWGPYSSSKNFDVNMATILILLVLATILAFALHAAFCFLLRLYRRHHHHHHQQHLLPTNSVHNKPAHNNHPSSPTDFVPTVLFSPGTKLAGGADDNVAECAICLSEFVDGERIRVLPACNHGFHVKCVEKWLLSKSSCPTCRTTCCLLPSPPEEP